MPITTFCRACSAPIENLLDSMAGEKIKCQDCHQWIVVPPAGTVERCATQEQIEELKRLGAQIDHTSTFEQAEMALERFRVACGTSADDDVHHFLGCPSCSELFPYNSLRNCRWRCPKCAKFLGVRPTQKQLIYAESLGIPSPEELSQDELSDRIRAARDAKTAYEEAEHQRRLQELQSAKGLASASFADLVQELCCRCQFILLYQTERQDDLRDWVIYSSLKGGADKLRYLQLFSFYHAVGEWPRTPTPQKGGRRG